MIRLISSDGFIKTFKTPGLLRSHLVFNSGVKHFYVDWLLEGKVVDIMIRDHKVTFKAERI